MTQTETYQVETDRNMLTYILRLAMEKKLRYAHGDRFKVAVHSGYIVEVWDRGPVYAYPLERFDGIPERHRAIIRPVVEAAKLLQDAEGR